MAFWTLPALRHFVHTSASWAWTSPGTRTRWRFGSKRRFVATIEWLRGLPKPGFFPQIAQTLDIGAAWEPKPLDPPAPRGKDVLEVGPVPPRHEHEQPVARLDDGAARRRGRLP